LNNPAYIDENSDLRQGGEEALHVADNGKLLTLQPRAAGAIFVPDFFIDKNPDEKIIKRSWDAFGLGVKLTVAASSHWHRYHRRRDVALLIMLSQLGYLTTSDIAHIFWPEVSAGVPAEPDSRGYSLWHARRRLRWLLKLRLVMRWWQLLPSVDGWRRLSSVFLLTQPGAAIAAEHSKAPIKSVIQRSNYRASGVGPVIHDLAANSFMVELARASAGLSDQGLYSWVSEPSMRRSVQLGQEMESEMADLAPDGWGRYLTARGEVDFHFEYDRGSEKPMELGVKANRYLRSARGGEQVLFLLPNLGRERSVRTAIEGAGAGAERWDYRGVRCWTTTNQRLLEEGVLGPIWQGFGADGDR
ncbi:MAG: replication-relaxation family protein, partial [Candidatus Dormibacteraceae bacterium]